MIPVIQILIVLFPIILIILFAFRPKRKILFELPEHYRELLLDYVKFYAELEEEGKKYFEKRVQRFLSAVKISGINAEVEDLDSLLIGAGAIIPVYYIPDWEYVYLREVLVYPGNFNTDFDQHGNERNVTGMVGTGALQNVMIISKWELRQGFIDSNNNRNTAIHEFAHLIDKMDGTFDGIPELLLERKFVSEWKQLIDLSIQKIRQGESDINVYGGTNSVEFFAVISEYFFEQPGMFAANHPELNSMMQSIFIRSDYSKGYPKY